MMLRSIWCKRGGVHKKESSRGMVKRMSTPDIYVAYYAFTWRVYGFLAGCKGMRRKNAGANDS